MAFAAALLAAIPLDTAEKAQRRVGNSFPNPTSYEGQRVRCYKGCSHGTLRRVGPKGSGKYTCQQHAEGAFA